MATMNKAQPVNEGAELRKEIDELRKENESLRTYCDYWRHKYEECGEMHMHLRNALDVKNAEFEVLLRELWRAQAAAMQRRAQHDVGTQLVD